jgi:F0F1-type ATP synthase epsilon subunit
MKLSIYTMSQTVYQGETNKVNAPTIMGEITILNNHESYVTILSKGNLKYTKVYSEGPNQGEFEQTFPIKGGFIEIRPGNEVRILADE